MIRRELTIIQAYMRAGNVDAKAAQKDWLDGKDFKIVGGPYLSIRDCIRMYKDGVTRVVCVDRHLTQMFYVDLVEEARSDEAYGLLPEDRV